jgi:hypothetical protein
METTTHGRFIALVLSVALGVSLLVALINTMIDPFGIYGSTALPGINAYKPAMQNRVRLVKAFDVRHIKPRALILGTSRSHLAIRTTHPGWDPSAKPRYNLAFDGATTHEMYAYLRHAHAITPLRQVILGLDTWHLNPFQSGTRPGFDAALLDTPANPRRHLASSLASLHTAFSADTAWASIQTLLAQTDPQPIWFAPDGQRIGEVFFHRPGEEYVVSGPSNYFWAIDRQEAGFKLDMGDDRPHRGTADAAPDMVSLDYVRLIIGFCRAEGIDLRIYITPAHAHQMELSSAVGEWPAIEAGKRDLVKILKEDIETHPSAEPFVLYDFSGYSSVTTETVPALGSSQEMSFYWDSSHFKEAIGDCILDRLFATKPAGQPCPPDFGMALNPGTIEDAIAQIRAGRARYREEHAGDAARVRTMVNEVWNSLPPRRRKPISNTE